MEGSLPSLLDIEDISEFDNDFCIQTVKDFIHKENCLTSISSCTFVLETMNCIFAGDQE